MGGVDIWMGLCDSYMFIWQWKFPVYYLSHLKYLNFSSANSPPNQAGSFFWMNGRVATARVVGNAHKQRR